MSQLGEPSARATRPKANIRTAMILAAGRGERMRPLTDLTPKPMLTVGGKCLLEWHIQKLVAAGIERLVINLHWLGEQIANYLGNGSRWGVEIHYSAESSLLDTAGGIANAMAALTATSEQSFLVVNGDVWSDIDYAALLTMAKHLGGNTQAILAMVTNPEHNPDGDFFLETQTGSGLATLSMAPALADAPFIAPTGRSQPTFKLTYAGIGLYHMSLFSSLLDEANTAGEAAPAALAPLLRTAIKQGKISGLYHQGYWSDVGTPDRLRAADQYVTAKHRSTM